MARQRGQGKKRHSPGERPGGAGGRPRARKIPREPQDSAGGQERAQRAQERAQERAQHDTYTARVRAILGGQEAPLAPDSGRRILFTCPQCARPWLQEGARYRIEIPEEELLALAATLHADMARLPGATCPLCTIRAGGRYEVDEYGAGAGYGFSWEGLEPLGAHLLGTVISLPWIEREAQAGRTPRSGIVTEPARCRAVLRWLAELGLPSIYRPLTAEDSQAMSRDNRPGHGMPGTEQYTWRGAFLQTRCAALGGRVLVTLAEAMPPGEPFSMGAMLETWRVIARNFLAGHMAGEPEEPGEEP